ncbi:MAG TPA: serine/threonine-protein kinase [Planctomycetota bacterium]|nr:serine/threonine-protein kinase [Planctomycetota bacterium]
MPVSLSADLYRVETIIWTGETAEICRAMAPNGKVVALKRLRADKLREWAAVRSLRREAHMAIGLSHPNVVEVAEFVPGPPFPIMVMEFFPCRNMKVRVLDRKGDPLLASRLEDILRQMAAGLHYVHERNFIHMDIKPENFLVSDEGRVKLTDFALATRAAKSWHRFLPGVRRIAGTRPYIAPETIRRKRPDFRTDIYSFGATLFEVLTRRPPFISGSRDELLRMHLRDPAPWPWTFNKNLTRDINDLVVAMLQKDPARRPQSMGEILARLRRMQIHEKPPEGARP